MDGCKRLAIRQPAGCCGLFLPKRVIVVGDTGYGGIRSALAVDRTFYFQTHIESLTLLYFRPYSGKYD